MTRTPTPATLRAPKPQQQTLSVRISDTLRRRLERAKDLMESTTGKYVSTSAIAKQLLESAREDRLEMVDLLAHPTDTLLEIRRKGDAQHLLSRAEWQVLAHFVRHGVEARSSLTPNPVSRDSFLILLDAFLAVYDLRTEGTAQRDAWYVGNLPSECRPTTATRSGRFGHVTPDVVRQTVTETRRRVSDLTMHATVCTPLMAGRNLSVLLEDEPLAGLEAVNRALRPYWAALWRLAARGHYVVTREPVRERCLQRRAIPEPAIPSITEGDHMLSFAREGGHEFSVLLSFPGALGPRYPIRGYPMITEFRAMLAVLASDASTRSWSGGYFVGGVADSEAHAPVCWFRAHDNGITFRLSPEEWRSVHALMRRAWDMPDIRTAWDALALAYGEL
jgi:hypothetical protein